MKMMKKAISPRCGFRFAQPRAGQLLDLTRGQTELPTKSANEGGLAAELKVGSEIDHAFGRRRRMNEPPQGTVEPLLLHIAR